MDEQVNERINTFLLQHGYTIDSIRKGYLKNLILVDEEIQRRKKIIAEAQKSIHESAINIISISNATNISRKTFYNNELLKLYVEKNESNEESKMYDDYRHLKEKVGDLEEKIKKLIIRDIDIERLNVENTKLLQENIKLKEQIDKLNNRYEKIMSQTNTSKKEPQPKKTASVIDISSIKRNH